LHGEVSTGQAGTRFASVALAVAALFLAGPGAARAAVTCDLASKNLQVQLTASVDSANVSVSGTNEIVVRGGDTQITCTGGPPTTANTSVVNIFKNAAAEAVNVTIEGPSRFAPGANPQDGSDDDPGATPEIEMFVNLGDDPRSNLTIDTDVAGESIRYGTFGINPNATPDEAEADVDLTLNGVARVDTRGDNGPDVLIAQGGAGTGGPTTNMQSLSGGGGPDAITGGEGPDSLRGEEQEDTIFGMGGNDAISPGSDNDTVDGGADRDAYKGPDVTPDPLTVDLGISGSQPIGADAGSDSLTAIEDVDLGATDAHTVRGDGGANKLFTGSGNDTLEGRGGFDELFAREGNDSLDVRDGGPDLADCGPGIDSVVADAQGVDTFAGCESVTFPPPAGDAGRNQPPDGGSNPPPGATPLAFGANTLVTLRLAAGRIPAKGPLAIRVVNANEFAINGTLAGRTANRIDTARKRRVKLRTKAFTVPAKTGKTVKLKLPSALRRSLARRGKLSLRLTGRVKDPAGNLRTVKKSVAPKLQR
jgi:hypothetical protein